MHHVGNPSFRKHLERLPVQSYTSVLILADEALEADSMHSDSASLACLLLLRHIQVRDPPTLGEYATAPDSPLPVRLATVAVLRWVCPTCFPWTGGAPGQACAS